MALSSLFTAKVEVTDTCWLWTGCLNSRGYGVVSINGRRYLAHRVAYEALVGPIPDGLEIDHVHDRGCTSKACVNPTHLEPVTSEENHRRALIAFYAARPYCPNGHRRTPANTRVSVRRRTGYVNRTCKDCEAEYRQRSRGELLVAS